MNNKFKKILLIGFLLVCSAQLSQAQFFEFEKRPPPPPPFLSYYVFPVYYSVPGVGNGFGFGGTLNYNNFTAVALRVIGKWDVTAIALDNIRFFTPDSNLSIAAVNINEGYFALYNRGIDSSERPLINIKLKKSESYALQYSLSFHDRQVQFYGGLAIALIQPEFERLEARNYDELIDQVSFIYSVFSVYKPIIARFGAKLDNTDNANNPKKGFRASYEYYFTPNIRGLAEFFSFEIIDIDVSKYITYDKLTWAFNIFGSHSLGAKSLKVFDEYSRGDTKDYECLGYANDLDQREEDYGVADGELSDYDLCMLENEAYYRFLKEGSKEFASSSLGGTSRLRGYPVNRFYDTSSLFGGIEARYVFYDLPRFFDFFVQRGYINEIQLSAFLDVGTVAGGLSELSSSKKRASAGAGLNFVFSGAVFRLNFAYTDEGSDFIAYVGQAF